MNKAPGRLNTRLARPNATDTAKAVAGGTRIAAIVLLVPSVVWILHDVRVWPWDHAYYGSLALQICYALHDGPLAWLSAFLTVPD